MKKLLIVLIAIIAVASVYGKVRRRQLSIMQNSVPETEVIANETMEFVYDYTFSVDTLNRLDESRLSDKMLLQIASGGLSKFSSYKNLTVDSLIMNLSQEQMVDAILDGKLSNGEFMTIYKNYPSGRLTHTDKICLDWFRYEEDMPDFDWQVTERTDTILGYECQEAKCDYRGREWTVWFTEDIPVMDGPWKLSGLPGLIMAASDEKGEYTFECVGINSKANRPITIYKVPFNVTSRKKYYDAKHRYDINPYAYYEQVSGNHVDVVDNNGNPSPDAYDPLELPYDYIESDWRK